MKLTTRIVLSFAVSIAIVIVIGCIGRRNTTNLVEAQGWVEHTHIVIEKLQALEILISNVTSGVRGYVVTSDERFVPLSLDSVATCRAQIAEIRNLTADNPTQQARLLKLETLLVAQLEYLNSVVSVKRAKGFDAAKQLIIQQGLVNIVPIHELIAALGSDEKQLLDVRTAKVLADTNEAFNWTVFGSLAGVCLMATFGAVMTNDIRKSMKVVLDGLASIGADRNSIPQKIVVQSKDEFRNLADGFNLMSSRLQDLSEKDREQDWLKSNLHYFATILQGQSNLVETSNIILSQLAETIGSKFAVVYGVQPAQDGPQLEMLSGYGCDEHTQKIVRLGEGLVGQCAKERKVIVLNNGEDKTIFIRTALTDTPAAATIVVPLIYEAEVKAVMEVASLRKFTETEIDFLKRLADWLAILFNSIENTNLTEKLLIDSQVMNEELISQQEELRQLNEELEQKAEELDIQNQSVAAANYELEVAQRSVESTVDQLAAASKYKSEFLANMSHDLRTPLNSLLILSGLLAENDEGNLHSEQIEFAKSISSSGKTLLSLVDNILDLSKIESGIVKWDLAEMPISDIVRYIEITFRHMAEQSGITFTTSVASDVPAKIITDERRLQQLLTNLLSNAFKFTEKGSVDMAISLVDTATGTTDGRQRSALQIDISDTGIGIAPDKQEVVFEAFQQADGSTKRKYGGTGLGLAICRQIARGLGGEVTLKSTVDKGSTFTVTFPIGSRSSRKKILVVEDDSLQREGIVRTIESSDIEVFSAKNVEDALLSLDMHKFDCMVVDLGLNGKSGYDLVRDLRASSQSSQLPVIVYTGREVSREEETALRKTTHAIIMKGTNSLERLQHELSILMRQVEEAKTEPQARADFPGEVNPQNSVLAGRKVLVVDDDARNIFALSRLLERHNMHIFHAESGKDAIEMLQLNHNIELVLMDIMMPEMDGCEAIAILRGMSAFKHLPILAVTAKAMKGDRQKCLDAGASDYITKPIDVEQLLSLLRVWLCRK